MKKAHNVYTEEKAWQLQRMTSLMHNDILREELIKHPMGSSSAFCSMLGKLGLLLDRPDYIFDKSINWRTALLYAKKHKIPLSKYITQLQ
jgi:hypothetical protein